MKTLRSETLPKIETFSAIHTNAVKLASNVFFPFFPIVFAIFHWMCSFCSLVFSFETVHSYFEYVYVMKSLMDEWCLSKSQWNEIPDGNRTSERLKVKQEKITNKIRMDDVLYGGKSIKRLRCAKCWILCGNVSFYVFDGR